jgi:hypothetical protein
MNFVDFIKKIERSDATFFHSSFDIRFYIFFSIRLAADFLESTLTQIGSTLCRQLEVAN